MQTATKTIPLEKFMNTLLKGEINSLPDLFEKEGELLYAEEIIIQVRVTGGTTIEMLTGAFTRSEAEKSVNFALHYCHEHFGKVLAWNWKGENIVRTPVRHPTKLEALKSKMKYYFGADAY